MVIDTSAILAILFGESEAEDFIDKIVLAHTCHIAAPTLFETKVVLEARKGKEAIRELELMMLKTKIKVSAFDFEQVDIAIQAWRKYGKGNHKAGLNMGDCFSYALAKSLNEALLFKGNNFIFTDVIF